MHIELQEEVQRNAPNPSEAAIDRAVSLYIGPVMSIVQIADSASLRHEYRTHTAGPPLDDDLVDSESSCDIICMVYDCIVPRCCTSSD